MKRIVICADGTWNRPEKNIKTDFPSNVLKLARAIKPIGDDMPQQVFYDWGVGSYGNFVEQQLAGATGLGLHKNIMDNYRYIVQNYAPGDELFFFGFSRGAYTIRCLCGLINNCGILKRPDAQLIQKAFNHYKKSGPAYAPKGRKSIEFRENHSYSSRNIKFVGVWDTVGAMGIPFSFLGFLDAEDEFYDTKIGGNIKYARHALAIDERRGDFEPTIWKQNQGVDLKQVWFAGVHSDIGGGSYKPEGDGLLSDIPLKWMINEAKEKGLDIEPHLEDNLTNNPLATIHKSVKNIYRARSLHLRPINHKTGEVLIHNSVKKRWENDPSYRSENLTQFIEQIGWVKHLEGG